MSYNSQAGKSYKKSMYITKKIDFDLPQNIMSMVLRWIECYNSNIKEHVKISMHFEVDEKLNDTGIQTSRMKLSNSGKKADNEAYKLENDIFNWLGLQDDKNVDYYSQKLSNLMKIDKNYIIKCKVNNIRKINKLKDFDPKYNKKEEVKELKENKEVKEKVVYGDAWDL